MGRNNLSEQAYAELLNRIISCEYAPGSLLNEERLVEDLGCSRTPIRAALVRLQEERLVQILPKRGILVAPITLNDIRDVYDLRELLETYAIEKFGATFEKKVLLEFLHIFESDLPENDFFYYDTRFHNAIIGQTKNAFMARQVISLQNIMQRMSQISGESSKERVKVSNQEHTHIITALLHDDLQAASEALRTHLNNGRVSTYEAVLAIQSNQSSKE